MDSTGVRLRKLRLEKGLSLDEVCKKTKIHPNVLKAIEEDSFVNLSPIYVKGFLKIYCKFLGVDPKDYIIDYQEPRATVKIKDEPPRIYLGFNFLKVIAKKIKIIAIAIVGIVTLILLFNSGKFVAHKIALRGKKPKPAPVAAVRKTSPKPISRPTAAVVEAKKEEPPKEVPAPKSKETKAGINLAILAKYDDCFIELKADGKTVFKNVLQKGRSDNWQAKAKFELSLGNARAVELELDGKRITSLGKRGQALKNILITKEGLVVSR